MSNVIQMQSLFEVGAVIVSPATDVLGPVVEIATTAPKGPSAPGLNRTTRLTALFNTEFVGPVPFLNIGISFDGAVAHPRLTLRDIGDSTATYSLLAFEDSIQPGTHRVALRALARENIVMDNRTLTVWETVVDTPQILAPL
jgi:hypothetical protein